MHWDGTEKELVLIDERQADAAPDLRGATARPSRSITRRSGLPTGRAVVGALLVTLSVVGLFVAYRQAREGPDTAYVVLRERVDAGDRITASDLTTRLMELDPEVAALATGDIDGAVGSIALETLLPGQLLQPQAILAPGVGEESTDEIFEFSFSVERSRVLAGNIRRGDRADIVATISEGGTACTSVVARDVRVVDIDDGSSSDVISSGNNRLTVTLALEEPQQVLAAIFAVDEADVTIVRSTRAGDTALSGRFCGGPAADDTAADDD